VGKGYGGEEGGGEGGDGEGEGVEKEKEKVIQFMTVLQRANYGLSSPTHIFPHRHTHTQHRSEL
jgi:hypothetical protein